MLAVEIEEERQRLFVGYWTYSHQALQGRDEVQPVFGVASADLELARRIQPPWMQVQALRPAIGKVSLDWKDLRLLMLYVRVPGFPTALLVTWFVESALAAACFAFAALAMVGVGTPLPALPSLAGAIGLSGLAVVSSRLINKWLNL